MPTSRERSVHGGLRRAGPWATPERSFLGLSFLFGALLVVLTPPVQVPDESHHLWRLYQLSEGRLVSELRGPGDPQPDSFTHDTGGRLPAALFAPNLVFDRPNSWPSFETLGASFRIRIDSGDRTFLGFSNTAVTPPLVYAPPLLGLLVARPFTGSVVAYYFAGRVANLVLTTLLIALAIRVAPIQKWTLVLVGLTPTALALSGSLSSDGPTLAVVLLFYAVALRVAFGADEPRGFARAALVILAGALALTRQVYFPLLGLLLLVAPRRLGGVRPFAGLVALSGASLAVLGAAWGLVVVDIQTPMHPESNAAGMIEFLRHDPTAFARVTLATMAELGVDQLVECLGVLGILDVRLPAALVWVHAAFLLLVGAVERTSAAPMGPRQRTIAFVLGVVTFLTIYGACFVFWGQPGDRLLDVRGRYFLPVLPLAVLPLHGLFARLPGAAWLRAATRWLVPLHLTLILLATVVAMGSRHYVRAFPLGAEARRHLALGEAFLWSGQVDDALREFQTALEIDPTRAAARYYLARIAAARDDLDGAVRDYSVLLEQQPGVARRLGVPRRLAWLLATSPEATRAERDVALGLAREVCEPPRCEDAEALDLLAAALAGADHYEEAARAAERALALSTDEGNGRRALEARLALYRARRPLRGPVDPEAMPPRRILPETLSPDFDPAPSRSAR